MNTEPADMRKPYPAYKDSGVEWLGEVPKQWEIKKIKRMCLVKRGASPRPIDDPIYFDDDGEYSWVRISDVTASTKYLQTTEQMLSTLGKSKSVSLEPGKLFLSIAGSVGKPIITAIKCCIHDGFVYFVGLKENREYMFYLFSSGELYKGLGKLGTQLNLNTGTVGDMKIPVPSPSEQSTIVIFLDRQIAHLDAFISKKERLIALLEEKRAIASFLDRETAKIDALIAKIKNGIEKLREYRIALISAAVTGKIDVREVV
jgi:type I restriction enzyme S subunit